MIARYAEQMEQIHHKKADGIVRNMKQMEANLISGRGKSPDRDRSRASSPSSHKKQQRQRGNMSSLGQKLKQRGVHALNTPLGGHRLTGQVSTYARVVHYRLQTWLRMWVANVWHQVTYAYFCRTLK